MFAIHYFIKGKADVGFDFVGHGVGFGVDTCYSYLVIDGWTHL